MCVLLRLCPEAFFFNRCRNSPAVDDAPVLYSNRPCVVSSIEAYRIIKCHLVDMVNLISSEYSLGTYIIAL